MQALFKKLGLTPIKFNKDGDISQEEFATLTVEIPMDSPEQRKAVTELLGLLSKEFIYVDVYHTRKESGSIEVTHTSPTGKVQMAKVTQDDVKSQLKTLGEGQK